MFFELVILEERHEIAIMNIKSTFIWYLMYENALGLKDVVHPPVT